MKRIRLKWVSLYNCKLLESKQIALFYFHLFETIIAHCFHLFEGIYLAQWTCFKMHSQ